MFNCRLYCQLKHIVIFSIIFFLSYLYFVQLSYSVEKPKNVIRYYNTDDCKKLYNGLVKFKNPMSKERLDWFKKTGKSYYEVCWNDESKVKNAKLIVYNEVKEVSEYYYLMSKKLGVHVLHKVEVFSPDVLSKTIYYTIDRMKIRIDNPFTKTAIIKEFKKQDGKIRLSKVSYLNRSGYLTIYFTLHYEKGISEPVKQKIYDSAKGGLVRVVKLDYNDKGNKTKSTITDAKGNLVEYIVYLYNAQGKLGRIQVFNSSNKLDSWMDYIYDTGGDLLLKKAWIIENGKVIPFSISTFQTRTPVPSDFLEE